MWEKCTRSVYLSLLLVYHLCKKFSERASSSFTFLSNIIFWLHIVLFIIAVLLTSWIFIAVCLTMSVKYFDPFGVNFCIYFTVLFCSFATVIFIISKQFCRMQGSIGVKRNICIKRLILPLHKATSVITVFWQQTQTIRKNPHLRHAILKHFIQKDQKTDPLNYRLPSLLPYVIYKIIKVVHNRINDYIDHCYEIWIRILIHSTSLYLFYLNIKCLQGLILTCLLVWF